MSVYDFSAGLPSGWTQYNDAVGADTNTVAVTGSTTVTCDVPSCGIVAGDTVAVGTAYRASVNVTSGKCALVALNASGISSAFTHALNQDDFALTHISGTSTNVALTSRWLSVNGDVMELIAASNTGETSAEGALYMRRNGGAPYQVLDDASYKEFAAPGVIWTGTKHVIVYMRRTSDTDCGLAAIDLDSDSNVSGSSRSLLWEESYNNQAYTALRHSNGNIYILVGRVSTAYIYTGVGNSVSVYKSADDLTTLAQVSGTVLNVAPANGYPRIFNEGYSVELSTGVIRSFFRNANGELYYTDFNVTTEAHSGPTAAGLMSPQAAPSALNLSDGTIALVWQSCKENSAASSYPRKVFALAISDDDCVTWKHHHIIAKSSQFGDSMTADTPYVNQPVLCEQPDGTLRVNFQRVESATVQHTHTAYSSDFKCGSNVSVGTGAQTLYCEAPVGSYLALVSFGGPAVFTASSIGHVVTATADADSINLTWGG